jgi:hypothetical protein
LNHFNVLEQKRRIVFHSILINKISGGKIIPFLAQLIKIDWLANQLSGRRKSPTSLSKARKTKQQQYDMIKMYLLD